MTTILKFSVELEELVGRKWQMAPNRMFQQLTDKTKKKKKPRPFYEAVDAHARRCLIIINPVHGKEAKNHTPSSGMSPYSRATYNRVPSPPPYKCSPERETRHQIATTDRILKFTYVPEQLCNFTVAIFMLYLITVIFVNITSS